VDYLTTFTGSAIAIVDTDVSIVDNDSPTLASATVTNPQALDILTFTGPFPGSINVSGSGSSVITLTGTGAASAADYQTALLQIRFDNTGTNPSTETRIIDVVVNDGTADSNDDTRYHRRERRPDQHRAGRAERRRGHHPADRRRLGGGHRQQRAHDHAVREQRAHDHAVGR
jgi:hypothetical protein